MAAGECAVTKWVAMHGAEAHGVLSDLTVVAQELNILVGYGCPNHAAADTAAALLGPSEESYREIRSAPPGPILGGGGWIGFPLSLLRRRLNTLLDQQPPFCYLLSSNSDEGAALATLLLSTPTDARCRGEFVTCCGALIRLSVELEEAESFNASKVGKPRDEDAWEVDPLCDRLIRWLSSPMAEIRLLVLDVLTPSVPSTKEPTSVPLSVSPRHTCARLLIDRFTNTTRARLMTALMRDGGPSILASAVEAPQNRPRHHPTVEFLHTYLNGEGDVSSSPSSPSGEISSTSANSSATLLNRIRTGQSSIAHVQLQPWAATQWAVRAMRRMAAATPDENGPPANDNGSDVLRDKLNAIFNAIPWATSSLTKSFLPRFTGDTTFGNRPQTSNDLSPCDDDILRSVILHEMVAACRLAAEHSDFLDARLHGDGAASTAMVAEISSFVQRLLSQESARNGGVFRALVDAAVLQPSATPHAIDVMAVSDHNDAEVVLTLIDDARRRMNNTNDRTTDGGASSKFPGRSDSGHEQRMVDDAHPQVAAKGRGRLPIHAPSEIASFLPRKSLRRAVFINHDWYRDIAKAATATCETVDRDAGGNAAGGSCGRVPGETGGVLPLPPSPPAWSSVANRPPSLLSGWCFDRALTFHRFVVTGGGAPCGRQATTASTDGMEPSSGSFSRIVLGLVQDVSLVLLRQYAALAAEDRRSLPSCDEGGRDLANRIDITATQRSTAMLERFWRVTGAVDFVSVIIGSRDATHRFAAEELSTAITLITRLLYEDPATLCALWCTAPLDDHDVRVGTDEIDDDDGRYYGTLIDTTAVSAVPGVASSSPPPVLSGIAVSTIRRILDLIASVDCFSRELVVMGSDEHSGAAALSDALISFVDVVAWTFDPPVDTTKLDRPAGPRGAATVNQKDSWKCPFGVSKTTTPRQSQGRSDNTGDITPVDTLRRSHRTARRVLLASFKREGLEVALWLALTRLCGRWPASYNDDTERGHFQQAKRDVDILSRALSRVLGAAAVSAPPLDSPAALPPLSSVVWRDGAEVVLSRECRCGLDQGPDDTAASNYQPTLYCSLSHFRNVIWFDSDRAVCILANVSSPATAIPSSSSSVDQSHLAARVPLPPHLHAWVYLATYWRCNVKIGTASGRVARCLRDTLRGGAAHRAGKVDATLLHAKSGHAPCERDTCDWIHHLVFEQISAECRLQDPFA